MGVCVCVCSRVKNATIGRLLRLCRRHIVATFVEKVEIVFLCMHDELVMLSIMKGITNVHLQTQTPSFPQIQFHMGIVPSSNAQWEPTESFL